MNIVDIHCGFNYQDWSSDPSSNLSVYTCHVNEVRITNPNTEIRIPRNNHLPDKSNEDIQGLQFINSCLQFFPRNLHLTFPRLTYLRLRNCGLTTISRKDLIGLENLEFLSIHTNELQSLPSNLFFGMYKLKSISFYCNNLEHVSSKIFRPLLRNDLRFVDLGRNRKIDAFYEPGSQGSVPSIKHLMRLVDEKCSSPKESETNDVFVLEFVKGFKQLWATGRMSDFVITAGTKKFHVHKCVLGMQSSVFEAIFNNDMREGHTNQMKIVDLSASAVEDFLHYFYTGDTPNDVNAMEVFVLASMYDVTELQLVCESLIIDNIDETNAHEVYTFGQLYDLEHLKGLAVVYLKTMFPDVTFEDDLVDEPENIKEIVDVIHKTHEAEQRLDSVLLKFKKQVQPDVQTEIAEEEKKSKDAV